MALIDRQIRPSKHMFSNPPSFVVNGTQTKAEIQIDEPKEGLVGQSLGWATSFPNCNQNLRSTTNRRDSTPQMIISIIELCATFVLRTSLLFCTCFPPSLLVPISQASSYLIFILIHCVKLTSIQDRSKKKTFQNGRRFYRNRSQGSLSDSMSSHDLLFSLFPDKNQFFEQSTTQKYQRIDSCSWKTHRIVLRTGYRDIDSFVPIDFHVSLFSHIGRWRGKLI